MAVATTRRSEKMSFTVAQFYLSSKDHQPAATGTSPNIFILASEPFFFIWS